MSRVALLCAVAVASYTTNALAESDNFDSGNDVGWTRYSPLTPFGVPGVFSFPSGGYRIQTTSPSPNPAQLGNGRTGSLRTGTSYTDFYVSVDLVNWNDGLPQAAGILARISTPGLGTTAGYAFTWSRGTTATSGDMDISKITAEAPTGVTVSGNDKYHFVPGRRYRMVFIGKATILEGRIYELPNVTTPVVTIIGSDSAYTSGINGLVVYDNSSLANNISDATFDNYVAFDVEPPTVKISEPDGFGDIVVSWPMSYFSGGFKLQYSEVLPAANWTTVPDANYITDPLDPNRIQFPTSIANYPSLLFRLRRP